MADDDTIEENVTEGDIATAKIYPDGSIISVNTDKWSTEKQKAFEHVATDRSNIRPFEGEVEHAYSLDHVINHDRCPECDNETERQYANFIYATQTTPRIMFTPAGYFCEDCSTVIIDEELIARGVTDGFTFHGVLGIAFEKEEEPSLFGTWNGSAGSLAAPQRLVEAINRRVLQFSGEEVYANRQELARAMLLVKARKR